MCIIDLMIPSNDTQYPPVEAIKKKECGCFITERVYQSDRCWVTYTDRETVTNYYLCPEHERASHSSLNYQARRFY